MTLKQRILELVTNDDGKLSRTQITLWLTFTLTVSLTIDHVVRGGILSWRVLTVLAGLHLFALADRIQAKFLSFHISKEGAGISLGGEATRAEAERLQLH